MTTPDRDLELRLRREASAWGDGPSAPARAALRARLATLPPARAPRWPLLVAALAAAAALVAIAFLWRPQTPAPVPEAPVPQAPVPQAPAPQAPDPAQASRAFDVSALEERALAPLRAELAGLAHDGKLLARGMWQQVPEPMRRLLE